MGLGVISPYYWSFFNPLIIVDRAHDLYFTSCWGCKLGVVTIPTEMVVKSHASIDVDEDGILVYSPYGVCMMNIDCTFIETVKPFFDAGRKGVEWRRRANLGPLKHGERSSSCLSLNKAIEASWKKNGIKSRGVQKWKLRVPLFLRQQYPSYFAKVNMEAFTSPYINPANWVTMEVANWLGG